MTRNFKFHIESNGECFIIQIWQRDGDQWVHTLAIDGARLEGERIVTVAQTVDPFGSGRIRVVTKAPKDV